MVGTLGWDAGKPAPIPVQTDSFDSENLILLLFPIFTLYPPHPSRQLEEGPCLHIHVTSGLGELNNFEVFGCFFFQNPLKVLLTLVLSLSNPYL